MAAETAVVMIPLSDSQQVVPQKRLARRGIDTAALEQQFPLPFIPGGICQIARNIGKG